MEITHWLDIINFGLVVLIWLVQLIIYPSFANIDADNFHNWHQRYVAKISFIVSPLMILQMFLILRLVFNTPSMIVCLMLAGIIIIWISSFSFSVPCHKILQKKGKEQHVIKLLVQTNWIRTVLWTAVFIIGIVYA